MLNSALTVAEKLTLLALAEYADASGNNCSPSSASLAELTSANEKTVRRALAVGGAGGWFTRWLPPPSPTQRKGVGKGWKTYRYTLRIPDGADTMPARSRSNEAIGADTTPVPKPDGADTMPAAAPHLVRTLPPLGAGTVSEEQAFDLEDQKKEQEKPAADAAGTGDQLSKKRKAKARALTFDEWCDLPRDGDLIPTTHAVFRYAEQVGLDNELLRLAWKVFCRDHAGGEKRQADWGATFHVYVRKNYLRLWYVKDGRFLISDVGRQAQLEHAREIEDPDEDNEREAA